MTSTHWTPSSREEGKEGILQERFLLTIQAGDAPLAAFWLGCMIPYHSHSDAMRYLPHSFREKDFPGRNISMSFAQGGCRSFNRLELTRRTPLSRSARALSMCSSRMIFDPRDTMSRWRKSASHCSPGSKMPIRSTSERPLG